MPTHAASIAVIVAILQGGLRIMPHAGGRLGRGLYFASENGKSSWYGIETLFYHNTHLLLYVLLYLLHTVIQWVVSTTDDNRGIMFLNEVVLGKEYSTTQDKDFKKAPNGYDSVVGRGMLPTAISLCLSQINLHI